MLICGRDVVKRVVEFDQLVERLSLRPWEWELLLSFDGRTPLTDIAARLEMELPTVLESVSKFCDQGLLTVPTFKLEEYRRRAEAARMRLRDPAQQPQDEFTVKEGRQIEFLPESGAEAPPEPMAEPVSFSRDEREEEPETSSEPSFGSSTLPAGIAFSLKASPPPPPSSPPGSIGFKLK